LRSLPDRLRPCFEHDHLGVLDEDLSPNFKKVLFKRNRH